MRLHQVLRSVLLLFLVAMTAPSQTTWFVAAGAPPGGSGTAASPFSTIGDAIAAAAAADEILVGPGVYRETLDFYSKGLALRSLDGPHATIIDANHQGTAITVGVAPAVIIGFTITGGFGAPGANATEFAPGGPGDGGAISSFAGYVHVEQCIIVDNRGGDGGNGLIMVTSEGLLVQAPGPGAAGAIHAPWGTVSLINTIVAGNAGGWAGSFPWSNGVEAGPGGIRCDTCTVVHCTFTANTGGCSSGGPMGSAPGAIWGQGSAVNSIFWGDLGCNSSGSSPDEFMGDDLQVSWSDVATSYPGAGNFCADPRFIGPAEVSFPPTAGSAELHLRLDSPCRGAGTLAIAEWLPATDIDREPRVAGSATGRPDCGADEIMSGSEDPVAALEIRVNGSGDWTAPRVATTAGDVVSVRLTGAANQPCILVGQGYAEGHPPTGQGDALHIDPALAFVILGLPDAPLGAPLLPLGGIVHRFVIPPRLAGVQWRMQGAVVTPTALNGAYALTPAVDLSIR